MAGKGMIARNGVLDSICMEQERFCKIFAHDGWLSVMNQ